MRGYRDYVEKKHLEPFDDWVRAEEEAGLPDAGNINPEHRLRRAVGLRSAGCATSRARAWWPRCCSRTGCRSSSAGSRTSGGGRPRRSTARRGSPTTGGWPTSARRRPVGAPARRVVSFDDVDQAVADIHWAKEHGLGGIMMPALQPGGTFFFDPALDPVWAACVDVGLPISQHGGAGAPAYDPPGFAALMTLAIEHSFFSGRSLWQMILGGVFERFPDLRMVFVETEVHWMAPIIQRLDDRLGDG